MRTDWDPNHRKASDIQRRYRPFTADEWRLILRWARSHCETLTEKLPAGTPAEIHAAEHLVRKIEQRVEDGTP